MQNVLKTYLAGVLSTLILLLFSAAVLTGAGALLFASVGVVVLILLIFGTASGFSLLVLFMLKLAKNPSSKSSSSKCALQITLESLGPFQLPRVNFTFDVHNFLKFGSLGKTWRLTPS